MPDSLATYGDGIKWEIGLSTAALAGMGTQFEVLLAQADRFRYFAAFTAVVLLAGIYVAAETLRWLNGVPTWKARIEEIDGKGPMSGAALAADREKLQSRIEKARTTVPRWHVASRGLFFVGCLLFACGIVWAAVEPLKSVDKKTGDVSSSPRYVVTYSAVHQTNHGREAHTFLLDQTTGVLWQMICEPDGRMVGFRRVRRLDEKGNPEPPASDSLEKQP
jgi:hypothetical protein